MQLLSNINTNFSFLQKDFVGITIHSQGIIVFFLHILLTLGLFFLFYFVGKKIQQLLFNETNELTFFINIALGLIVIGTGLGFLGIFSLFTPLVISLYLGLAIFTAIFPLKNFIRSIINLSSYLINKMHVIQVKGFLFFAVLFFIALSCMRLSLPEIGEDGYHTDLPRLYLSSHTSIHESKDPLHVIPYPQLAEMVYIIPIFLGDKEATRFIHFGFYLLTVILLYIITKDKQSKFAPILFVTAPVVFRYSATSFIDFFMVFMFLLSVVIIAKSKHNTSLSGFIYGAVLSIKIWTLVYLPTIVLYLFFFHKKVSVKKRILTSISFVSACLLVVLPWYIRSYIITGNPIFPIFARFEYLETNEIIRPPLSYYLGLNWNMFSVANMIVLSPLFFLGVIYCLFAFPSVIRFIRQQSIGIIFVILTCEQLIARIDLGRYLLAWYTLGIIFVSSGISHIAGKYNFARYLFVGLYSVIACYYLLQTLMLLPYGLGFSDRGKYLTRVLYRDNANYYDFDQLFSKWITKEDLVATYGIYSYYYADFSYIDVNFLFSSNKRNFDTLKKEHVTRLLIKGGDIKWFCKRLSLVGCNQSKTSLLASYPKEVNKYNLYKIN